MAGLKQDWVPSTYLKFEDERTRPARDLVAQVGVERPRRVVDMGCGPGNSTQLLVERFPEAEVVGLDNSPAMLAEARLRLPGVRFAEADAATWVPEGDVDLVFANASYQWVPGHLKALQAVLEALPEGGVLAVQMPDNREEATHRLMREVAGQGPWSELLADAARGPMPTVRDYYDGLSGRASRLDIWHTIYNHVLDDADAVVDWVRGTGLRPFLDPLDEAQRAGYLAKYRAAIAAAYPPAADGKVLLRFPRLFIVATR